MTEDQWIRYGKVQGYISQTPDAPFMQVVGEIIKLHNLKQADYANKEDPFKNVRASEDFGIPGWIGALARGNDKMKRLQKVAKGGTLANESVEDSMLDLAVYVMIALCLYRETKPALRNPILDYLNSPTLTLHRDAMFTPLEHH